MGLLQDGGAACAKIEDFVALAPDSLEGHYRAGVCAEKAGALDPAARSFRWVLDRHRSSASSSRR